MKSRLAAILAIAALTGTATGQAHSSVAERYAGGGRVAVTQINGVAVVDNGGAICRPGGVSEGGACVPFADVPASAGDRLSVYVGVDDDTYGSDVAFQVCVDNNGDGVCGGPEGAGNLRCGDDQFFSHAEDGRFFNPLGPLPTTYRQGCPGNAAAPGYVVFLCTGVHANDASGPHTHLADAGSVGTVVTDDSTPAYGTFCGGGNSGTPIPVNTAVLQAKPYIVE